MSDAGKIDLVKQARELGYRTYLYYVCIEDPLINIDRVADRVRKAGHNVPADKIIDRHRRSLSNAVSAVPFINRAYFWNNSGTTHKFLGEITDANVVDVSADEIPYRFEEFILNRL
jgi:predicted ABC-type ATPase